MKDMYTVNELKRVMERYGIRAYLPSVQSIVLPPTSLDVKTLIGYSDCILVLIGREGTRSENVDYEIGMAAALNKLIIPIVEEGAQIPNHLVGKQYILIDRNQPQLSYERAAQYLNRLKIEKENREAIGGLLLLGLGLILLGALSSGD
jgi:hypothetical protein